jgi:hypothetical protein
LDSRFASAGEMGDQEVGENDGDQWRWTEIMIVLVKEEIRIA